MMTRTYSKLTLLFLAGLLALFACVPQTPIPVYITPTPAETTPTVITPIPTLDLQPSATNTFPPPTVTGSPAPPTATAEMPLNLTPTSTIMGAIVGPEYTLQPTETPRPSETPLVSETPVSPTVEVTPLPPVTVPALTGTPLPLLDAARMGIQVDYNMGVPEWDQMMYHAEMTGVGWVKVQANWSFLQPNSPDEFGQEFGLFQLHIQNAKKRGFKVLISVAKAPAWARSTQEESGPPDNPQLLANFIGFLLSKVGPETDAIEIWNEPNLAREWAGKLPFNGAGYMQLFAPAYNAIRAYSPAMGIITAGLAPTGDSPGSIDDRTYMQQMYNAGLVNYRDIGVGIHPYSWGNPPDARCCNNVDGQGWDDDPHFFFSNNIEDYRSIMVRNGHSDVQMWATEFGWATWQGLPGSAPDGDVWMSYVDLWQQANYTIRAFEIGQSLDYMGPMILWNLNFANPLALQNRQEIAAYAILVPSVFPQERPLYWLLNDATR